MRTKQIDVAGKKYTLTVKRNIVSKLYEICPEMLKIGNNVKTQEIPEDVEIDIAIRLSANMDVIFYDMIKIAHPTIDRAKSDEIYEKLTDEYGDVEISLVNFIKEVFTGGIPAENKKKLNW